MGSKNYLFCNVAGILKLFFLRMLLWASGSQLKYRIEGTPCSIYFLAHSRFWIKTPMICPLRHSAYLLQNRKRGAWNHCPMLCLPIQGHRVGYEPIILCDRRFLGDWTKKTALVILGRWGHGPFIRQTIVQSLKSRCSLSRLKNCSSSKWKIL